MCSALVHVSPHGFKNDVYFTCSVRLFRLAVTRELTSESPIDSCQEELSPSYPIESVCQLFQPPSLLLTFTSGTTDQAPCTHFRSRSRSDSIRPRVKTTRLRSSVLDMYDWSLQIISHSIYGPNAICRTARKYNAWKILPTHNRPFYSRS